MHDFQFVLYCLHIFVSYLINFCAEVLLHKNGTFQTQRLAEQSSTILITCSSRFTRLGEFVGLLVRQKQIKSTNRVSMIIIGVGLRNKYNSACFFLYRVDNFLNLWRIETIKVLMKSQNFELELKMLKCSHYDSFLEFSKDAASPFGGCHN